MSSQNAHHIFALLQDLKEQDNSHNQGIKRVFVNRGDVQSALTQFAHGCLKPGQESGFHSHVTMDEYFYFVNGKGLFVVNEVDYQVTGKSFIRVPAGSLHNLRNNSDGVLEFVYFGIAREEL